MGQLSNDSNSYGCNLTDRHNVTIYPRAGFAAVSPTSSRATTQVSLMHVRLRGASVMTRVLCSLLGRRSCHGSGPPARRPPRAPQFSRDIQLLWHRRLHCEYRGSSTLLCTTSTQRPMACRAATSTFWSGRSATARSTSSRAPARASLTGTPSNARRSSDGVWCSESWPCLHITPLKLQVTGRDTRLHAALL
jgi:hypothetical protein